MKVEVSISKRKRRLFESILSGILPIAYQVDIMSNHAGESSRYEIPYETESQKKTIISISKAI